MTIAIHPMSQVYNLTRQLTIREVMYITHIIYVDREGDDTSFISLLNGTSEYNGYTDYTPWLVVDEYVYAPLPCDMEHTDVDGIIGFLTNAEPRVQQIDTVGDISPDTIDVVFRLEDVLEDEAARVENQGVIFENSFTRPNLWGG